MNEFGAGRTVSRRSDALSVLEARALIDRGAVLIDVRPDQDYSRGHVKGSLHFPLERLHGDLTRVPKDRALIVLCQTGVRSGTATTILRGKGLTAYTLRHGLNAWSDGADITTKP